MFGELIGEGVALVGVAECFAFRLGEFLNLPGNFLLLFGQVACLGAELFDLVFELAGAFLSEILLEFLEVALRPGACGECLGDSLILQFLGSAAHIGTSLFELIAGFGHLALVFGSVHPLLE